MLSLIILKKDPDAPIRQNKPLHDLDQEDEYKLMEYVFSFIRAGDLNSARNFLLKIESKADSRSIFLS